MQCCNFNYYICQQSISVMNSFKGIKDIMDRKRYRPMDLRKAFRESNVPGNWKGYQNIYNVISGICAPKDPYAYVVIAKLLDEDVETIILRYSRTTGFSQQFFDQPVQQKEKSLDWDDLY